MESGQTIRVILADDHAIVREGIAAKFREVPEISILGQCSDGECAVELILTLKPDFAIIDLNMPGLGGIDVLRTVRLARSETKIIVLSITREDATIRELFRSGADGYVLKDGPARHLIDAINYIRDGGQYLTPLLRRETLENNKDNKDPLALLSRREFEVFSYLVDGMRPRDIGKALEISPKTVDTYRANIMRKLEVDGIASLVKFAIQRNSGAGSRPS